MSRFPSTIRKQPRRTRWFSRPQRLMMKPAMRPPTGVPREGMMSLMPAFDADSESTTWKKSGIVKRNCSMVSFGVVQSCLWNTHCKSRHADQDIADHVRDDDSTLQHRHWQDWQSLRPQLLPDKDNEDDNTDDEADYNPLVRPRILISTKT